MARVAISDAVLERDDFSSNHRPALAYWWSMIFSENRYPAPNRVRAMLFRDHAPASRHGGDSRLIARFAAARCGVVEPCDSLVGLSNDIARERADVEIK